MDSCHHFQLSLLLLILVAGQIIDAKAPRVPYEELIFELKDAQPFHENLKYPPYRRCVIPKKYPRIAVPEGQPGNSEQGWRLFWSQLGWSSYYIDNDDETYEWEAEREEPITRNKFAEHGLPICFVMCWIIVITVNNLILYPLLSMITIRIMLLIWAIITHKWIRRVMRRMIVRHERFKRDHVIRVYQDAGRRPPFYRYNLPRFFRENIREAVPKELDETDEEFWSSDEENDEDKGVQNLDTLKKLKATPEFTPEYPHDVNEALVVSDEMFSYLIRVSHHGMFAVWTSGLADIDLDQVTESSKRKVPFAINNAPSEKSMEG